MECSRVRISRTKEATSQSEDLFMGDFKHREKFAWNPINAEKQKACCTQFGIPFRKVVPYGKAKATTDAPTSLHRTRGDGNCFFWVVSFAVTGSEALHQKVCDNVTVYLSGTISQTLQDYLQLNKSNYIDSLSNMLMDGVWATDAKYIVCMAHIILTRRHGNGSLQASCWPR